MKRFVFACLLASLSSTAALAYEADIHYSTTYVLARAVGWPADDARIIASANEGVDENEDTVAALELDAARAPSLVAYVTRSLHQAGKNLEFHCFGRTSGPAGRISADVLDVVSSRFAGVPERDADPRGHTRRLIALGTALHCQQDAFAHAGFGGSCGSYVGSCLGHAYETLLDQVIYGVANRHYFNPDHPGVTGRWLLEALEGTSRALAAHRPRGSARPLPRGALAALAAALRGSGLELPDDTRRDCNRYVAGRWLSDVLHSGGGTRHAADGVEELAPGIAAVCKNESLAAASVARIPAPQFPRLNADASPALVRADGTYQLVPAGTAGEPVAGASNYPVRAARVQLTHWNQLLALPFMGPVALVSGAATRHQNSGPRRARVPLNRRAPDSAGSGDTGRPRAAQTSRS